MVNANVGPTSNPAPSPHMERQAVRLKRAGRTVFQIAFDGQTFGDRIPQSPSTIPSGVQRAFEESHARRIYRYILDNPTTWAFNPIIVAVNARDVEWEPIPGTGEDDLIQNGTLRLASGSMDRMRILDGQHRRAAIQDVLRVTPAKRTAKKLLAAQESLLHSAISVEMYIIDDDDEVKQIFADMARQRSISSATRAYMDQRDPYNAAAVRLLKERTGLSWLRRVVPPLESKKQAIRDGVPFWFNAAGLAQAIRHYDIGQRRLSFSQREEEPNSPTGIEKRVRGFFEKDVPAMRPEWEEASSRTFDTASLAARRDTTIAFSPVLLYAAALVMNQWRSDGRGAIDPVVRRFRSFNLSSDRGEISEDFGRFLNPAAERASLMSSYTGKIAKMIYEGI